MEDNTTKTSLFIAHPGIFDSVAAKVYYPVGSFYRYEVSFLQRVFYLPLCPDQTNLSLENTRAQVRYSLLPVIERLGFGLATRKEQDTLPSSPRKEAKGSTYQSLTPPLETRTAIKTFVLATQGHVRFELPGTRTPNCPIKSRELYH